MANSLCKNKLNVAMELYETPIDLLPPEIQEQVYLLSAKYHKIKQGEQDLGLMNIYNY
jgi:hypothetical protein